MLNKARRSGFCLKPSAAAVKRVIWPLTAASTMFTGIALAQESQSADKQDDDVEVIQVSGIRASLVNAIASKRDSDKVMDGISAEDIGKLPDTNIAEALQRVTGVQIQRENGEGAFVSIRGLDPTFTKVTVNGQSLTAARSRAGMTGFNLSILGASTASALEVLKSPTADMEEGGVGGSVNIKKLRPLELGETKFASSLEGVYEEQRDALNPRFNVFYSDLNEDKTFGYSLQGYVYRRDFQRTRVRGNDVSSGDFNNGSEGFYQSRLRPRINQDFDENVNLNSTIEWKVSDSFRTYLDVTYGTTDGIDRRYDTEIRVRDSNINTDDPAFSVNDAGFVEGMPVSGFRTMGFGGFSNTTEDRLYAYAWGGKWSPTDNWNVNFEAASSKNYAVNDDLPGFGGALEWEETGDTLAVIRFGQGSNSGVVIDDVGGVINFGNVGAEHLGSSFGSSGTVQTNNAKEQSFKTDFEYILDDAGMFETVQFGFKYTKRDEIQTSFRRQYTSEAREAAAQQAIANADQVLVRLDDYVDLVPGLGVVTGIDVRALGLAMANDPNAFERRSDGVDDELYAEREILAGYVLTKFYNDEIDYPVRGNLGVRVVNTDTFTRGFGEAIGENGRGSDRVPYDEFGNPQGFVAVESSSSDTEVLPTLNLAVELNDELQARVALARVMRRPEIRQLTPFFEIDLSTDEDGQIIFDDNVTSGEAGNPNLDPFLANQLDLTLEYYFDEGALLSAGYFYKDVENFITEEIVELNRTIQAPDGTNHDVIVQSEQYVNGGGATVKGFELSYQQAFTSLPAPFDGLGTVINYTFTDSEQDESGRQLPGTSENTYNATVFYEKDSFGIRLAYNYRDAFPLNDRRYRQGLGQLDLSMNYQFNDNLKFTFTATNLTEEAFVANFDGGSGFEDSSLSVDSIKNNFQDYEYSGRQFFLGAHYSF